MKGGYMNEQLMMQMQEGMKPPAALGVVPIIIMIVVYIFFAWCMAKIAKKLGMEFGTAFIWAIIPIANIFLLLKLSTKPMWWFILFLIPIVNIVISVLVWMSIAERFGKPGWWGILIALVPVANIVMFLILAFEKPKAATA